MSAEQELELLTRELLRQPPQPATAEAHPIGIEEIRPSMTESDKTRAFDEILRVLRGGE